MIKYVGLVFVRCNIIEDYKNLWTYLFVLYSRPYYLVFRWFRWSSYYLTQVYGFHILYHISLRLCVFAHPLTGAWVLCKYNFPCRLLVRPFLGWSILEHLYPFVSIMSVCGLPFPWVFPGGINTHFFSNIDLFVRGVNANWAYHSMVWDRMVFCEIILNIVFSLLPNYVKMRLYYIVSYPVEPYLFCSI